MENQIWLKIQSQPSSKLIAIIDNPGDWDDAIVKAAIWEISLRGGLDAVRSKVAAGDDSATITVAEREIIKKASETHFVRNALLVIAVILIASAFTKPSDKTCIDSVKNKIEQHEIKSNEGSLTKAAVAIGTELALDNLVRVDDHVFYKTIYEKGTGHRLAIGLFGQVFFI